MYFLKITIVRKVICYFRYIFFVYFLKKYNFLSSNKKDFIPVCDKPIGDIYYKNNTFTENKPDNYLDKLSKYEATNLFKNPFSLKNLSKFGGARSGLLLNPILSCTFLDKKNIRVLSIGPRTEGEIYNIISKGFLKKNIDSIDVQSYSPLISLGDMHEMRFSEKTFDLILCGWVMTYSYNRQKAINEIIRVSKNNAIICIGSSYHSDTHEANDKIKSYLGSNLKKIYYELNPSDFPEEFKGTRHSLICFSVKK